MASVEHWHSLRGFAERGPAEAFCVQLESEGVPTRIQANALENAIEARFFVLLPTSLAHRARWVTPEFPVSEGEIHFLATGKLPGQE
jgi:hypothetical protein